MLKNEIKVLIVEDDGNFNEALKSAVEKAGYLPVAFKKPDEALAASKLNVYNAAIIDCMLPKMSGVDLAVQLKAANEGELHVILISGIYKDKGFIKESLGKTKAVQFLTKPFNIEDLLKLLDEKLGGLIDEEKTPLDEVLTKVQPTPAERTFAVANTPAIHGFDLPKVIGLLLQPSISGALRLKGAEGKPAAIHFSGGRVIRVEVQDSKSFFGALLVEKELVDHAKMEEVLKGPNPNKKRVGERLIEANLLSPHHVSLVNTEQMALRLSKLVADTAYEVTFEAAAGAESEGSLDWNQFTVFLSDWIMSKYTASWLKTFYRTWGEATIVKTPKWSPSHPIWAMPSMARIPEIRDHIDAGGAVLDFINKNPQAEEHALSAVHLLLLSEMIAFQAGAKRADLQSQLGRLKKIQREMESQNDFEVLGVNNKANSAAIKKAYHDLSKSFHPDRLAPGTPAEIMEISKAIYTRMTTAYNHIGDDAKRADYIKELEKGRAEKVFQAEGLIEEGKTLLKGNQALKALEKFQMATALRGNTSELILHTLWARMACMTPTNGGEVLKEAGENLNKIAPEDRHNALYYFVKGLFQKNTGDYSGAKSNFSHAVNQQPDFVEAKRELNIVSLQAKEAGGKKDLLKADLGDLIGGLFRKK